MGLNLSGFYCEVPAKLRSPDDGEVTLSGGAWGQEPQCVGRCLKCRLRGGTRQFCKSLQCTKCDGTARAATVGSRASFRVGARSENQGEIGSRMLEAYGELGEMLTCHEYFGTPVAERLALPHKDKDE